MLIEILLNEIWARFKRNSGLGQRVWAPREQQLAAMGIWLRELGKLQFHYVVPPGVKPPDWMLAPEYRGTEWRVYHGPRLVKSGPIIRGGKWVRSGWDD